MKLAINNHPCDTFKFHDTLCDKTVMEVHGNYVDMHCNNIKNVDDPNCSKDAANKRYVDNLASKFRSV